MQIKAVGLPTPNLSRLTLSSADICLTVRHTDAALIDGFYVAEATHR